MCRLSLLRKMKGFTLIELLVVVAIIALLLSILLPSLSGAREQAKTVKCSSQLSGIGRGVEICQLENNGHLPNWDDGALTEYTLTWTDVLFDNDYISTTDIASCPSDDRPSEIMNYYGGEWAFYFVDEFGMNEQIKNGMRTSYAISEIAGYSYPEDRYKDAARQVVSVDGNWSFFFTLNTYWLHASRFGLNPDPINALNWGDPWVGWRHGRRHGANALFFDSHVSTIVPKKPEKKVDLFRTVDPTKQFVWLPGESIFRRWNNAYQGEVFEWIIDKRKPKFAEAGNVKFHGREYRHPSNYPFERLNPSARTAREAWRKLPSNPDHRR